MTWWHELIAAGAVPATFAPPPSAGAASDIERIAEPADLVEDAELQAHALPDRDAARIPGSVAFLAGIERWSVVAYDGVVQVVNAYVAAAIRRRDERGVLRTTRKASRAFALAPLTRMKAELRRRLEEAAPELEPMDAELVDHPTRYLDKVESTVRRARGAIERDLAEAWIATASEDDWLVLDGRLSRSPAVARHPRALGVIKSHGAQFLEGRGLERALTLPAGNRTSVFAVRGGHTRTEVYSWYLRLWPWEGNDLLYGLLRVEMRPDRETIDRATELSGWLWAERAPLATPATRWDRLLYPLHNVEEYLKTLAPRDPQLRRVARLPKTGS
jgi:hypothetical protein